MLSDKDILRYMKSGDIIIYPFKGPKEDGSGGGGFLGPDGYYVHFMEKVKFYKGKSTIKFDDPPKEFEKKHLEEVNLEDLDYKLTIGAQESVLVATLEEVGVSKKIGGVVIPSLIPRVPLHAPVGVMRPGWNHKTPGVYTICLTNMSFTKPIELKASYIEDSKVHWGDQIACIKYDFVSSEVLKGYDDSIYGMYKTVREPQPPMSGSRFEALRRKPMPLPDNAPKGSKIKPKVVEDLSIFMKKSEKLDSQPARRRKKKK